MITIVSKENCPYCVMAKNLLTSLWFDYKEIDVSDDFEKLREVVWITWMMTVPQIFNWEISQETLLWGYDDINWLHNQGKLVDILNNLGSVVFRRSIPRGIPIKPEITAAMRRIMIMKSWNWASRIVHHGRVSACASTFPPYWLRLWETASADKPWSSSVLKCSAHWAGLNVCHFFVIVKGP